MLTVASDIPHWDMRNRFFERGCMDCGRSHRHDFSATCPTVQSTANVPTTADQFAGAGTETSTIFHLRGAAHGVF